MLLTISCLRDGSIPAGTAVLTNGMFVSLMSDDRKYHIEDLRYIDVMADFM